MTFSSQFVDSVERMRTPRYFDVPTSSLQRGYICGKDDDNAAECTMPRRNKSCYSYGGFKHTAKHCNQGRICFKCRKRGHIAKDCLEEPLSNKISDICLRCGDSGHDMFSCQSDYSSEDLKEIQCYVCKECGHLCCVGLKNKGQTVASCYKCGQTGHLGSGCMRQERQTTYSRAKSFYNHEVKCHFPGKNGEYNKARKCTHESATVDISFSKKEIIPNFVNAPLYFGRGVLSNEGQRLNMKTQEKEPMAPPSLARKRNYVTWNSQMDGLLTSTLFDQMEKGNFGDDDFKSQVYQAVIDKLRLNLGISVTEFDVKNRIKLSEHYPLTEAFPPLTESKQTSAEKLLANIIYKLQSNSDLALESKGSKGKNVAKASGQVVAPTPQSLGKRQRTESSDGNKIVRFPHESCTFLSPASIESQIEAIPRLSEEEHLKRLKVATDNSVSSTYKAFLDALYVRNVSQGVSGESKSQKDIFDHKAENIKDGDELRLLHFELEAVKKDLEAEKEKTAELRSQLDGIAKKAMAKGRGDLAIQHRNGLSSCGYRGDDRDI